ncbi:MAG: Mth938-like domain-containing protein [Gammaproteobacteria bacterium]
MKFHLEGSAGRYSILSYAPGRITVKLPAADRTASAGREILTQSLIISPGQLLRGWPPQSCAELRAGHFEQLIELNPEVVLFGSGAQLIFPSASTLAPLIRQGIGIEVMSTDAACRTYNLLMADGRRVTAALLMI